MFASCWVGCEDAKGAMKIAERQLQWIYVSSDWEGAKGIEMNRPGFAGGSNSTLMSRCLFAR
jgi:hypothetical protein